jgi:hypothetical protein
LLNSSCLFVFFSFFFLSLSLFLFFFFIVLSTRLSIKSRILYFNYSINNLPTFLNPYQSDQNYLESNNPIFSNRNITLPNVNNHSISNLIDRPILNGTINLSQIYSINFFFYILFGPSSNPNYISLYERSKLRLRNI